MTRRFQFSLRALLVATLLASLAASVAHYRRRAEIDRAAAALERMERHLKEYRRVLRHGYLEGAGHEKALREAEMDVAAAEKRLKELTGR